MGGWWAVEGTNSKIQARLLYKELCMGRKGIQKFTRCYSLWLARGPPYYYDMPILGGGHGEKTHRHSHGRRRRPRPQRGHQERDLSRQCERHRGRRSPPWLGGPHAPE